MLQAMALTAAVAVLLLPWSAMADERLRKKVLLIGIDGCRPDALKQARVPHLDQLIREGAFSDRAQTDDITDSGPCWSSMLTGVWRAKHGVRDNHFEGANYRQYPHFFRRLKQARPQAFTASVVHWAPINTRIVADADVVVASHHDSRVAEEAARLLRERDPDAVFVHFDDVDAAGHLRGFHPNVAPYRQAIERTDAHVGRLLEAVRGRRTYEREDWLILVATDHGGSARGHGRNVPEHRTIFLIVSGPAAVRARIDPAPNVVDVAATALTHVGVAIDRAWDLDGKPVGLKGERRRP
jgi:predicted AlkP superfamily pyrophosphatase or phosphodiesterase